jgi:hypothetical protein
MRQDFYRSDRPGSDRAGLAARVKRLTLALTAAGPVLLVGCGGSTPPVSEDGWQTLLDGSSLRFWDVVGDANWRLEDNSAVADSSSANSYLVSTEAYADFELELEFWVDSDANSGVFLRCQDPEAIADTSCYEANIFDTRPDQTYRTGSIVNVAEPTQFIYTGGQWNRYRIRLEGDHIDVELNGKDMVDVDDAQFASGPIALQYGSGTVRFRHVRVRPL